MVGLPTSGFTAYINDKSAGGPNQWEIKYIIDKINLRNVDIYDNDYQSHIIDTEYIVCRAFKKLPEILRISRETLKKPHKLIVMLGKSAQDEINKASKGLIYKYKLVNSITSIDSKILLVDVKK